MAAIYKPLEVNLAEFLDQPDVFIVSSRERPVALIKDSHPYAYLVGADYFALAEEAIEALHGNRRVIVAEELSDEDDDFLTRFGPSASIPR